MTLKRILLSFWLLLLAVTAASAQTQTVDPAPTTVRVMTFNIWVGGELVDFGGVVEAIRAAKADVVGLQEPTGNTRRIAEALGWQHYSERTHIISRFPLIDPPAADGLYVYVQIRPGQIIAAMNVHLTSDPYGPYAVRDGAALEDVLQLEEETRLPDLAPYLEAAATLQEQGIPVVLTGDFNTPSHLDWTEAAVGLREGMTMAVAWPVTQAAEAAGFVDTFRAAHPDPVAVPGITWTYGYPYPRLNPGEMVDRIDLVLAAGDIQVQYSEVVGEGPDADIEVIPYPSDHRAVVSTLITTPVTPPYFVAVDQHRVERGERVVVQYHAPNGENADAIGIVAEDSDTLLMWLPPYEASFHGSVTFGTGSLEPGVYAAVLVDPDGSTVSRAPFTVVEAGAQPRIFTEQDTFAAAEPITVRWENAPGLRLDWVAIYAAGEADLYNGYWAYAYTGAAVSGTVTFDAESLGEEMLPPGDYEARLMLDDGYSVLASWPFTVGE